LEPTIIDVVTVFIRLARGGAIKNDSEIRLIEKAAKSQQAIKLFN
jgi:hypothetical protein